MDERMKPEINKETGKYQCRICDLCYSGRKSFNTHRHRKHGTIRNTLPCPMPGRKCANSASLHELRLHLKKNHDIVIEAEKRTFCTRAEFVEWKEEVQKATKSIFVHQSSYDSTELWHCNRSGAKRKESHCKAHDDAGESRKKRAPLGKGSAKTGVQCPATISVKFAADGTLKVQAYLSYFGHKHDVCYLSLSRAVREKVKQKLKEGFDPSKIAEYVQDEAEPGGRDSMIQSKDVLNIIRRELPELIGMFHKDDHQSVDLAVQYFSETHGDQSPIIYYHPRTKDGDKFSIGIQTQSMRQLLNLYSGNVVCMDTTHKPCMYDGYLLGTLLVLDSTGAGQPVAWFLVKGEKEEEMLPVFHALKQRHPNLQPRYFMTDCADAFWNTWKSVFGQNTKRLWCKWHVWRAWTSHISQVSGEKRRQELRQMLKHLLQAPTKQEFDLLSFRYEQVMKHEDFRMKKKEEVTGLFGDYLYEYYLRKGALWARFGRLDSDVSCNMHLESFHRMLKNRYLKRLGNRRIDFLVHLLISKVAPNFNRKLQRLITMHGIDSSYQQRTTSEHRKANYLLGSPSLITEVVNGQQWLVQSSTGQLQYTVQREADECPNNQCLIKCQHCQVCPHQYQCTCPRFGKGGRTACKHVHAIHCLFDFSDQAETGDQEEDVDVEAVDSENLPQLVPDVEMSSADPPEERDVLITAVKQVSDQHTAISTHLQTLSMLVQGATSLEEVRKVDSATEEVKKILVSAIVSLRRSQAIRVGTPRKKHKLSPQKPGASRMLAFDKKKKKKTGLTTAEKEANEHVKARLSKLDEVIPWCIVCDETVDSQKNLAQKCSLCSLWCHTSCVHVCIK